jgi:GNAT superfamily N-acetyltransferase
MVVSPVRVAIVDEARTRDLRRRVLRPELGPDDPLPGDDLPDGIHLGAVEGDAVLCTCFVYADPCPWIPGRPAWHLRQMATEPDRRGQGLGAAVVRAAVNTVAGRGAELLWCNARETALGFYAGLGFRTHGPVFTDERHTIPHIRMWWEPSAAPTSSE